MFTKMNSAALGAALMLFAGTVNADATAVTYADLTSWIAAVPGYTPISIPEPTPGLDDLPHSQYFETGTVTYNGVTFSTSALGNGFLFNIGPGFEIIPGEPAFNGTLPVLSSQQQSQGVANILITLAAPVNAFALNFDTFNVPNQSYGYDVIFQLSNGSDPLTLGSPGNAYDLTRFFGVVDDTPFKTILLTSSGPVLSINELNIGAAVSPIPEPATWVMLLLGFAGIGLFGARRRVRRAAAC
ncbi:PEP-CTERM sorting domain-containing protein [Bradyrhizobium sp. sBnM-33]|uniref:PEP-CTERM sorting domain-containing protein n=1 Tax=Bradyrhizobium sp. sBnM-33 TaxID=2831780 RepID=UPI001BD061DD|nr:PEP-CTERM sorting domain-containing protein [Bradyrhizobium sp. sBnM-33]WOH53746.1 PEP-CTERM sorting domain-containing protein [Bradyrhizobium sp. sBnM-33]